MNGPYKAALDQARADYKKARERLSEVNKQKDAAEKEAAKLVRVIESLEVFEKETPS